MEVKVLVTGIGGGGVGQQIIKALRYAKNDYVIYGTDITSISKGFKTVDYPFVVPRANDGDYIITIIKICKKHGIKAIFPGSEVEIALEVSNLLKKNKIKSRVISVPCLDIFEEQTSAYKKKIIGDSDLNVSIEAGSDLAWEKLCTKNRLSISMSTFGASAPYKKLYEYFGISPQKIYKKIINKL